MRYIIGIDLGTTNSALAFVDLEANLAKSIKTFPIPQLGPDSLIQEKTVLPSSCYLLSSSMHAKYKLPWGGPKDYCVGVFAHTEGSKVPTQLVQSAKSWLCHAHAMRKSPILPVEVYEGIERISPVDALSRYLNHLREAWNFAIAKGDLEKELEYQDIILTVPASFDEVARTLTVEAAKKAGFNALTLLEEPQAAFYNWMGDNEKKLESLLKPQELILIVDVGGGTADFSLIEVKEKGQFDRVAVGEHLLLGGDNMDEAVAYLIKQKLAMEELSFNEWHSLKAEARKVKEALLKLDGASSYRLTMQAKGSKVVKNTTTLEITKQEVRSLLMDGFFGNHSWEDALILKKPSGLKPMGLPYAEDPSISKHLASFLKRCGKKPNHVLFNGGTMKAQDFRMAILDCLRKWFKDDSIGELKSSCLDLSVARGASQFGKARKGLGKKIGGGIPRSYYVEVEHENKNKALTIFERGGLEGQATLLDKQFLMLPNTPVSFKVFTSQTRLSDRTQDLIEIDELEMHALPALHTVLRMGKSKDALPVQLEVKLTEIGILEVALQSKNTDHRWLLEFQLRDAEGKENSLSLIDKKIRSDEILDSKDLLSAKDFIETFFKEPLKDVKLMEGLEKILGQERKKWPISTLRALLDKTLLQAEARKKTDAGSLRFWNAIGFFLRPGFGFPLDDYRIKEIWKLILADWAQKVPDEVLLQKWICYRRIAGGFNKGQQLRLAEPLLKTLSFKNKQEAYFYTEKLRTLASLEWLEVSKKLALGEMLMQKILKKEAISVEYFALGRLGSRKLMTAPFTHVIAKEFVEVWLEKLFVSQIEDSWLLKLCVQLACKTSHMELNISEKLSKKILKRFPCPEKYARLHQVIREETEFNNEEQEAFLADTLPIGLKILTKV